MGLSFRSEHIHLNNNIFELAYYFLTKFNLYYRNIQLDTFALDEFNNPDNVFYIYTVDLIKDYFSKQNIPIFLKPADNLNNKMPEIYVNDYLLYVNNETYLVPMKVFNWLDFIYRITDKNTDLSGNDFINCYCKHY